MSLQCRLSTTYGVLSTREVANAGSTMSAQGRDHLPTNAGARRPRSWRTSRRATPKERGHHAEPADAGATTGAEARPGESRRSDQGAERELEPRAPRRRGPR